MRGKPRGGRGRGSRGGRGFRDFWQRGGPGGRGGGVSRGFEGPRNRPNYGRQDWGKPKRNAPSKRLSEQDIGVTQYVNDHEGFNGIIKARFSDFHVSEINEKGEVAKLTDLSPPELPGDDSVVEDEDLLLNKYNPEILPMDTWDRINRVATSTGNDVEKVQVDVTGMTKEQRTKIHDAVKKAFGGSIVGSTITVDDKKYVTFDKYRKGVRIDNRVKWVWGGEYVRFIVHKQNCDTMEAAERIAQRLRVQYVNFTFRIDNRVKWVWGGEYVRFIVHKQNCDTMEAAERIAQRLRVQLRSTVLGYAGTKDRRAKTSQWFSLRKFDPRKIAAACADLRDVLVGNYSFSDTNLQLGMLKGNQFRICIRNVTAPDERVDEACELLRERGFINYYGLQRFGTRIDAPTYHIGKQLLQGNFREAIKCILGQRSGPMSHALHLYHTVSARAALQALPPGAPPTESKLLRALAHNENDLIGAMDQVARNARLLYVHAYQSLVWNRAVSARLQRLPRAPAPGDLVPLADVIDDGLEDECEEEDSQNEETEQNGAEKKTADKQEKEAIDNKTTDNLQFKSKTMIPVKVLTQEDCDSGRYSIFDVVMPLPGHSVEYPPNMKEYYKELLTKDELKLDMKHRYKSYSMCGGYRHVIARPTDVSWRCVRYDQPNADLILSDADELAGRTATGATHDGKYKALFLTMSLPPSSYATMALRELLKVDTSGESQALQNNYHKKTAKDDKGDQKDDQSDQNNDRTDDQPDQNEKEDGTDEQCDDEDKVQKRKLDEDSEVEVKDLEVEVKRAKPSDCLE